MQPLIGFRFPYIICDSSLFVAGLVNMVDSTQFSTNPKKSVSFTMNLKGASYYLSLSDGDVVAKVSKFIFSAFKFTLLLSSFVQLIECDTFLLIYGKTMRACS